MTVCILRGHGASIMNAKILEFMFSMTMHPHGIPVKCLTHDDLNTQGARWQQDGSLLVFGGGEFTKVKEKLSAYGREAIIDFVSRKSYLGTCMGGYGGGEQARFFGQNDHRTSDGFGFFNGVARGSLPLAPSLYTGKSDSACITRFRHEKYGIEFPALYWGGPCFDAAKNSLQDVEKLVTLRSAASDQELTMGIKVPVGDAGQAVLLGYHPEATPPHIRKWVLQFCESPQDIARIQREMESYANWEYYLGFACLLDDLGIVPHHNFLEQVLKPSRSLPEKAHEHLGLPPAYKFV